MSDLEIPLLHSYIQKPGEQSTTKKPVIDAIAEIPFVRNEFPPNSSEMK
jgi:hypothetical protein